WRPALSANFLPLVTRWFLGVLTIGPRTFGQEPGNERERQAAEPVQPGPAEELINVSSLRRPRAARVAAGHDCLPRRIDKLRPLSRASRSACSLSGPGCRLPRTRRGRGQRVACWFCRTPGGQDPGASWGRRIPPLASSDRCLPP